MILIWEDKECAATVGSLLMKYESNYVSHSTGYETLKVTNFVSQNKKVFTPSKTGLKISTGTRNKLQESEGFD